MPSHWIWIHICLPIYKILWNWKWEKTLTVTSNENEMIKMYLLQIYNLQFDAALNSKPIWTLSQFTRTKTTNRVFLWFVRNFHVNHVVEYAFYSKNCKKNIVWWIFCQKWNLIFFRKFNFYHRLIKNVIRCAKNFCKNSGFRFPISIHFLSFHKRVMKAMSCLLCLMNERITNRGSLLNEVHWSATLNTKKTHFQ